MCREEGTRDRWRKEQEEGEKNECEIVGEAEEEYNERGVHASRDTQLAKKKKKKKHTQYD
jgi:hypothetical protein